ncbi:hypothetical protein KEJ27_09095 [Candidatus Bathyarchaeota archaeon]|nr:hypothetical protein [Candidatus Bathyarchaeota archaeon]MBS7618340.1 hypothetical protein [Candidatus Bathyarchaeota archaeon]
MSSSIPHVIGTMALLMCSIFVITSFILLGFAIQLDLVKPQLQEVAEYTASTIVDLVTLANQTDAKPLILVKELKIPSSVAERGFTINLTTIDGDIYVHVYLTFLTTVSADAPINVRDIHEVKIGSSDLPKEILECLPDEADELHSGLNHPVVWCVKDGDGIVYIGLGVLSEAYVETAFPMVFLKYETMVSRYIFSKGG